MEALLKSLLLLSGTRSYTVTEIAKRLDTSERNVYRYFNKIESAGFYIDRSDKHGKRRYRLSDFDSNNASIRKLLHFSDEELTLLFNMLDDFEATTPVKENLIKKLHTIYNVKVLNRREKRGDLNKIKSIGEAIEKKLAIAIKNYRSSHSKTISDRIVEPFEFLEDYAGVWCYDIADNRNKQFRISRMGNVELTNRKWKFEQSHNTPFVDAFRMSAQCAIGTVEATLSLKAYNLICEEFPLTHEFIIQKGNQYLLNIPIADFHGIGRFILGLPGEIEVLGPEEFKVFLKNKITLT